MVSNFENRYFRKKRDFFVFFVFFRNNKYVKNNQKPWSGTKKDHENTHKNSVILSTF